MSVINDCVAQLHRLLHEFESTEASYGLARRLYQALSDGEDPDLTGIGMKITFGDSHEIPVPFSADRERLMEDVVSAANFLGQEIFRLWGEMHRVTGAAVDHCQAAAKQADAPELPQQPQQPPVGLPLTQSAPPFTQAGMPATAQQVPAQQVPAQQQVPRLTPVSTTDVSKRTTG